MACPKTNLISDRDFIVRFSNEIHNKRIPLNGGIDLTQRCNLRCIHCYQGPERPDSDARLREMSTELIISVIDQIAEAGCLFFLITGGEPLLRPDFREIYSYVKRKGILPVLFTNGTLINEDTAKLFAWLNPQGLEISIYGASEETYERVTGVAGSFGRCIRGIELLREHGVRNVSLKTVVMTHNRHEFDGMVALAHKYGLPFRIDAAISPRYDGDRTPLTYRIPPEDAVNFEFMLAGKLEDTRNFLKRHGELEPRESLYICGAGVNSFHISAYGMLQPCMMPTGIEYDLNEGDFAAGWNTVINSIMTLKPSVAYECNRCEKRLLCGHCPAYFMLECGRHDYRSEYLCREGHMRYEYIKTAANTGGRDEER